MIYGPSNFDKLLLSSSAVHSLGEASKYAINYPYDCNEQLTTKIMTLVSLQNSLEVFRDKELPSPKV